MPTESINLEILEWHPAYASWDRSTRYSAAYDFGISHDKQFKVNTAHCVWAYNEDGSKQRHYHYDETLLLVRDGASKKYFTTKKAAEMSGYKFSFRCGCFMKEDNPEFYGSERILGYHSNARADYSVPDDNWKVGVEVEKEEEGLDRNENVWKLFQETGWAKERDSSLGNGGFELVSPILPLQDRARIKTALKGVKKYLNANHSRNCGGHINLSCKGKTSTEVLKSLKAGAALLYAIYEPRMANRYCPARQWDRYFSAPDKYSSFYLKNEFVCEIRLFPAVKSMNNLIWRLDLVRWLIEINGDSFVKKIVSLNNRNSYLSCHLRKIYTEEKIRKVGQKAIKHYQKWIGTLTSDEKEKLEAAGYVVDPSRILDEVVSNDDGNEVARRREPRVRNVRRGDDLPAFDNPNIPF